MGVAWDEAAVIDEVARQTGGVAKASDFYVIRIDYAESTAKFGPKEGEVAVAGCIQASKDRGGADIGGWYEAHSEENLVYIGEVNMYQNATVMWIGKC